MKNILTSSKDISHEYCASIIRVGEMIPIEGSDYLAQVIVEGYSVVVRKDEVKPGDIMFYAANETMLNKDFLRVNNQFGIDERALNDNFQEVDKIIQQAASFDIDSSRCLLEVKKLKNAETSDNDKIEELEKEAERLHKEAEKCMLEAKSKVGFFNKAGRVKMVTLRKCPSLGYLFSVDAMAKYCPEIRNVDLAAIVDNPDISHDFDTVNGELFIKVYVPPVQEKKLSYNERKRIQKVKRFNRMIDGEFKLHYDTDPLNKYMYKIKPDDIVTISVKLHGTSAIFANVKVKQPKTFNTGIKWLNSILNKLYYKIVPEKWQSYTIEYGNVYSSRTVIKNQYINQGVTPGYYNTDVWKEYNDLISPYIEEDMTIYGEIVGYTTNSNKTIQKNYDYGCIPGTNKLMIYRIVYKGYEWNVQEVYEWTVQLIKEHPELKDNIHPIDILFNGTLHDLYPNISISEHWHKAVLEALKTEERFGMDKNEPLCKNKVPREGIVLRIYNDPKKEAFKLKCNAFLKEEGKLMDKGEVDSEMSEKYA